MSTSSPAYLAARKLYDEHRLDEARQSLQRSLQRSPSDPDLNTLMGGVLLEMGQAEQAIYFLERAVSQSPEGSISRAILGEAQMHSGRLDAAEKSFTRVLAADASAYSPRINLANILIKKGAISQAEARLREAVAIRPERFEAVNNLALLMLDSGRADEAAALVRERMALSPNDPAINRCLANILNYVPEANPGESLQAHRTFGDSLVNAAATARASLPAFANSSEPDRPLRIAYMSPDFREHSVAYFIAPLLRAHDRRRFQIYAYSNTGSPDATTERIKSMADHWRDISRTSDIAAVRQARADQIDILIDLAGLTNNHRLGVLALRAAPVQMTYCGYPSTTGLSTVDYRIADEITDPPDAPPHTVETLLRLQPPGSFSCYEAPPNLPIPAKWDPAQPITFGSFNILCKVAPPVVAAWSRILQQVPGSRLILKARSLAEPSVRERYAAAFAGHGIAADCLELLGPLPSLTDHLALYSRIGIALDPFPYNGTTTTYEALWMGVPVVTLAGQTHAGRVGASILTGIGEPSLIAGTLEDYIATAARLATDHAAIVNYRGTLRERLATSPLCDAPGYARRFESALIQAWHAYCK